MRLRRLLAVAPVLLGCVLPPAAVIVAVGETEFMPPLAVHFYAVGVSAPSLQRSPRWC